ncbi:MAG: YvcK family protein [Candidatus Obscuribacter phosphatis]|uniref:Putative gluconeogenesis factor n=1 Tax=Candidatus Obscuribacter phosphatis TaxID=1906157 RepID=A0A8J7PCN5_9BACT|nr:YvcK family protein [Candidatus Obscuribacter phosphatis]
MKRSFLYRIRSFLLPGLKRYILVILMSIAAIVFGVLWLLDKHPVLRIQKFMHEVLSDTAAVLPSKVNGIIFLSLGSIGLLFSVVRVTQRVLGAYLPDDREAIPDVLYRRRYLERGPKIVVVGGGTGLSNLLNGLKRYSNNLTAIVTVGDDGGSSGRLRQELGVLPPGDIRNCITALADQDKIVTELFRYRFESGEGLEGHSFGNLFITALCAVTGGDIIKATRTASHVLNSCGQVLPSTLSSLTLTAEFVDGTKVTGESVLTTVGKRIKTITCEPALPEAVQEAVEAILDAELIVLGPGSLYTSIIPNLLVPGIVSAIRAAEGRKLYVCNVSTQAGETTGYSVGDHVEALLAHAGSVKTNEGRLLHAVLVNEGKTDQAASVRFDPEKVKEQGLTVIKRPLTSDTTVAHHDSTKLARAIVMWLYRTGRMKAPKGKLVRKAETKKLENKKLETAADNVVKVGEKV